MQDSFVKALRHLQKQGLFTRKEEELERVRTGLVGFDYLCGGGVPRGRILELYGFEGSGKTTLAAEIARVFQANNERVIYLDYEHAIDLAYLTRIGVKFDDEYFLYEQPDYLEQGLDAALKLIRTGSVGLLIVDSVAAMVPKDELEGTIEDYTIGLQARKMGQALRVLADTLEKHKTTALFINQLRDKIGGNPYERRVDPTTTPGGRALKFFASIRLEVKKGPKDDDGAYIYRVRLRKQKTAIVQFGTIEIKITERGVNFWEHIIRSLKATGLLSVRKSGAYFQDSLQASSLKEFVGQLKSDKSFMTQVTEVLENAWSKGWKEGV